MARLQTASVAGRIELLCPDQGIGQLQLSGEVLAGKILSVRRKLLTATSSGSSHGQRTCQSPVWPAADTYVRGNDLVATYAASDGWPYLTQLYWQAPERLDVTPEFGSVSLLVSLQTSLPDTWPELFIESHVAAEEVLCVTCDAQRRAHVHEVSRADYSLATSTSAACILRRLKGRSISFLEAMRAGDARDVSLRRAGDGVWHSRWELFGDFLEKGVIRRARLESSFVAQSHDLEFACAVCQSIDDRPLPLTT